MIQPPSKQQPENDKNILLRPQSAILSRGDFTLLKTSGEVETGKASQLHLYLTDEPLLCCFAPHFRSLNLPSNIKVLDLLELFAFTKPATFCVPTPDGLSKALNLQRARTDEDRAILLLEMMDELLYRLQKDPYKDQADPLLISQVMGQRGAGWAWTPYIYEALGQTYDPTEIPDTKAAMRVWKKLPEWSEEAPPPPSSHHPVTGEEAIKRLDTLLSSGQSVEERPIQKDYTRQMTHVFKPAEQEDETHVLLAEAGTGIGKTLGYLAPASVWAEKNEGSVWISTYTKNLQRQIDQELYRLYPDEELRRQKTTIRKGRENYLCLLNLEEASAAAITARDPQQAVAAGLMARWTVATKDGDLTGADFPGWLSTLLGFQKSKALADRRGECIYAACDHYHKCFIERSARKSRHARIVVANHALVMINAAISSASSTDMPSRYIFDEGHHLFDAADSAFAIHLTALETKDLRRWIIGPEGGKRGRARGLRKRIEDLIKGDATAEGYLQSAELAAHQLPAMGWTKRLSNELPDGSFEKFFHAIYHQVHARSNGREGPYSIETDIFPLEESVLSLALEVQKILKNIQMPLMRLSEFMRLRLENDDENMLSADERRRLDSLMQSLDRRAHHMVAGWIAALDMLKEGQGVDGFIEWFEITRIEGKAIDLGLYRHWVDPMRPFASTMKPHAQGLAITSATLTEDQDWNKAKAMTGTDYLSRNPLLYSVKSPFDYEQNAKVFIINDVRKDDIGQVAAAYQSLFSAAGGGALGLFTAIQRLRAVHQRIQGKLSEKDITLYSQHIDEMDPGTLVDIFRDEENSCLLGTDAIRDGVDVPGRSLRLIAFDRVPWPRPTILHKARRNEFGRKEYDDMITGLKLKQAFGRLIRKADDKGVFVMLDPMLPSRLQTAFPENVEIQKCGLSAAVKQIKDFLHE